MSPEGAAKWKIKIKKKKRRFVFWRPEGAVIIPRKRRSYVAACCCLLDGVIKKRSLSTSAWRRAPLHTPLRLRLEMLISQTKTPLIHICNLAMERHGVSRVPASECGLMCVDTMFLTLDGARQMNRVYCNLQRKGRGDNAPCDAYDALNNIWQYIVSWNLEPMYKSLCLLLYPIDQRWLFSV